MSKWLKRILILLTLFVVVELFARFYLGLGHLPVYVKDPAYEYIYAPNQDLYRFGNHFCTNEFSMRSKPLQKEDGPRILKFGDSVINGGPQTDQDSLASTLMENELFTEYKDSLKQPVRVLNISAQSWGPDNAFAYMEKNGNFDAEMIILVFSSHDLHDNMHFKDVVGHHKAWPEKQPWCATTDGFNRYFIPWLSGLFGYETETYDYLADFDDSKVNTGWADFIQYSRENHIPMVVYVHPVQSEVKNHEYDKYGKALIRLLEKDSIEVIQGLNFTPDASFYRDNIHLNNKGQRALKDALMPQVRGLITKLRYSK